MFKKMLIANRGEIACRIIRSAKKMGIQTIAVYSTLDIDANHVSMADEAFELGPPPPSESYLNTSQLLRIAQKANADAIHPGYGFLSENADFAQACEDLNITFIGPKPKTIRAMANKDQAKEMMAKAGIPITTGYLGEKQDPSIFLKESNKIGYPILLKAVAGGGGRGMRLVTHPENLIEAFESARRESKKAFGDDRLMIEKFIQPARHIELQVCADQHGNRVHLYDRECSIQRRHQKIIEEAPAPHLSEKTKQAMQHAALRILEITDYINAGTIEFLVDEQENFYFMEMNTRLQVEHPVTECITGIDLVEWQIKIAHGEALPLKQSEIPKIGHAIEARVCAENPFVDFVSSTGILHYLDFPDQTDGLRIDTGVSQGSQISLHYDSMIAKIITYGENREEARLRLQHALSETHIVGVESNTEFLWRITQNKEFAQDKVNTDFIEHNPLLLKPNTTTPFNLLIIAALAQQYRIKTMAQQLSSENQDQTSPWLAHDQWRLNHPSKQEIKLWIDSDEISASIAKEKIEINTVFYPFSIIWHDEFRWSVTINEQSYQATVVPFQDKLYVFSKGTQYKILTRNPAMEEVSDQASEGHLRSPMPGNIIEVAIKPNEPVKKGQKLIVLEAMKMEHKILAPKDGTISDVHCTVGETVSEGMTLIDFAPDEANQATT